MLKRLAAAGVATWVMAIVGGARADVVDPSAYDWSGPYVGLQAGYGWKESQDPNIVGKDFDYRESQSLDPDGAIGGAHFGYLFQSDSFVYGLESDLEFANMKDEMKMSATCCGYSNSYEIGELEKKIDWLGSLRLRAGYAMDEVLFYATGGLAVGGVKLDANFNGPEVPDVYFDETQKSTEWGWTLGAGLEYAFTDALSARIEYRYTDLSDIDINLRGDGGDPQSAPGGKIRVKNDFHAVRAGLSWRF